MKRMLRRKVHHLLVFKRKEYLMKNRFQEDLVGTLISFTTTLAPTKLTLISLMLISRLALTRLFTLIRPLLTLSRLKLQL